jgi:hypothetical protein
VDYRPPELMLKIAIHEAGHAVVARAAGVPLLRASIQYDRFLEAHGQVRYEGHRAPGLRELMVAGLAGRLAEAHFYPDVPMAELGGKADLEMVAQFALAEASGDPAVAKGIAATCREVAQKLVATHAPVIEAFAKTLLQRRTLRGDLAEHFVDVATSPHREEIGAALRRQLADLDRKLPAQKLIESAHADQYIFTITTPITVVRAL